MVWPIGTDGALSETVSVVSVGGGTLTVTVICPWIAPDVAIICAVPGATPVITPAAVADATAELEEVQVTAVPESIGNPL